MDLATKYRPHTFEDYTEQSAVVKILKNICGSGELVNRNFLFIGPAGTGKTSVARILNNVLNNGESEPIEVDAASYSGVDNTREIVQQMKSYPLKGRYKFFIIDECFPGNLRVVTDVGPKRLDSVSVGDCVLTNGGYNKVQNVFVNTVPTSHLTCVSLTDGRTLITTKGHLFFTNHGWIEAENLGKEDVTVRDQDMQSLWNRVSMLQVFDSYVLLQNLYNEVTGKKYTGATSCSTNEISYEDMSCLWERVQNSSGLSFYNLFTDLCWKVSQSTSGCTEAERTVCSLLARIYLSCVREKYAYTKQGSSEILQLRMLSEVEKARAGEVVDKDLYNMWTDLCCKVSECVNLQQRVSIQASCFNKTEESVRTFGKGSKEQFAQNETKQPYEQSFSCSESDGHEEKERDTSRRLGSGYKSRWEREVNSTADYIDGSIGERLGTGVCNNNTCMPERQSEPLPQFIQSRPSLSRFNDSDRGGWQDTLFELCQIIGLQENNLLAGPRVGCVEVYKRGNNDRLFESSFTSEQLHSEYVDMYDLEVEDCHNYFVEGTLVHNCHALSSTSWQVMLKVLEEPPARTVTCMCTTNPEKIPATILSRVQTFQLSKISLDGIVNRLEYILNNEGYKEGTGSNSYSKDAVVMIGKLARGGMRDAITLLTKVLAYSNEVNMDNVSTSLSLPSYDDYFALLNAVVGRNNEAIVSMVDKVYNSGVNFVEWFSDFHSFLCNIVKYICMQDVSKTMIPPMYSDKISKYGTQHLAVCLKWSQKLLNLVKDLKGTQYLQETAITYLCSVPRKDK